MRIDADCHIAAGQHGIGIDELLRRLDAVGVEKAVCWPMVTYAREIYPDNRAIYDGYKAHPDRIIPFGGVNPMLGMQQAQDELKRCIEEYGVVGVKLNGARDGYYIDHPELSLPLVQTIADRGIALAFHCGANDFEKTHPFRIASISDAYPNLRIMIVHMGGGAQPSMSDAVIDLAKRYRNWWLIDSEADYRKIHRALKVLGAERVCYGSDTPFVPMRFEWGIRQVVYQDIGEAERTMVFGDNMARMLGLGY
jgi:predicted TIM-barrel fold metal-dependent hydrolase